MEVKLRKWPLEIRNKFYEKNSALHCNELRWLYS